MTEGLNKSGRPPVFNQDPEINASPVVLFQTAELAEHTSKITLLEEARKRKEEEATTWQLKVRANCSVELKEEGLLFALHPHQKAEDVCVRRGAINQPSEDTV